MPGSVLSASGAWPFLTHSRYADHAFQREAIYATPVRAKVPSETCMGPKWWAVRNNPRTESTLSLANEARRDGPASPTSVAGTSWQHPSLAEHRQPPHLPDCLAPGPLHQPLPLPELSPPLLIGLETPTYPSGLHLNLPLPECLPRFSYSSFVSLPMNPPGILSLPQFLLHCPYRLLTHLLH